MQSPLIGFPSLSPQRRLVREGVLLPRIFPYKATEPLVSALWWPDLRHPEYLRSPGVSKKTFLPVPGLPSYIETRFRLE